MKVKALVCVLALIGAGSACIGGKSAGDTTALVVTKLVGAVRARAANGASWYALKTGDAIPPGGTVQVPPRGAVALKRGELSSIELRPYDGLSAQMKVVNAGAVDVTTGDTLVKADKRAPIMVTSQGVTAAPDSTAAVDAPIFRFDRRVSVRVGVYTGEATVSSVTGSLPIPALREGIVAARQLPRTPSPLTIDPKDVWDIELLSDVIDLDTDLDGQSRGYEAEFGATMKSWHDLAKVLPNQDLSFVQPYIPTMGSADILIGVVFSYLWQTRTHAAVPTSFGFLMNLLDQGASWGLLAHQYLGAGQEGLLKDAVARAIALRTGTIKPGGQPIVTPTQPSTQPSTSPSTEPSTSPTATPTHSPKPSSSPTPSGAPTPTPSQTPGICVLLPSLC